MRNKLQFKDEQIHSINTRQIATAILVTLIICALIALLILRQRKHTLEVYSASGAPVQKTMLVKTKLASSATSYAPATMSFNLPAAGSQ